MIRPLRRIHLAVFSALLVVLPLLFWLALAARKPPASMPQLPPALEARP